MEFIAQFFGALFGALGIIFGAFGAHALKKVCNENQIKSFETGVKYQMYHALLLLILGFNVKLETSLEKAMVYCIIIGVFLFSFSIYGLCISSAKEKKLKILGPITPLGGLLLVLGWGILWYTII